MLDCIYITRWYTVPTIWSNIRKHWNGNIRLYLCSLFSFYTNTWHWNRRALCVFPFLSSGTKRSVFITSDMVTRINVLGLTAASGNLNKQTFQRRAVSPLSVFWNESQRRRMSGIYSSTRPGLVKGCDPIGVSGWSQQLAELGLASLWASLFSVSDICRHCSIIGNTNRTDIRTSGQGKTLASQWRRAIDLDKNV